MNWKSGPVSAREGRAVREFPQGGSTRNARREAGARRRRDDTARRSRRLFRRGASLPRGRDGDRADQARSSERTLAEGVVIQHSFSAKPKPTWLLPGLLRQDDATYAAILSGPAQQIDPDAKAADVQGRSSQKRRRRKRRSTTSTPLRAGPKSM